jgi:hypothetical protein
MATDDSVEETKVSDSGVVTVPAALRRRLDCFGCLHVEHLSRPLTKPSIRLGLPVGPFITEIKRTHCSVCSPLALPFTVDDTPTERLINVPVVSEFSVARREADPAYTFALTPRDDRPR